MCEIMMNLLRYTMKLFDVDLFAYMHHQMLGSGGTKAQ